MSARTAPNGFTLVEVIIAMVILTIGMLALAAGTSWSSLEVHVARQRTQRAAAAASAIEQVRAKASDGAHWDALASLGAASAFTSGQYKVWYDVSPRNNNTKRVTVYTLGPGYRLKVGWQPAVQDTFVITLNRPFP